MDFLIGYLFIYLLLFLSGFPFLFFCLYGMWSLLKRSWIWDKKRKLMLLNAAIYPFIFSIILIFLVKLFGVNQEAQELIRKMYELNTKAILEGGNPTTHNTLLGALFLSGIYFVGTLIPTTIIGFIYSLSSTTLLIRSQPKTSWWLPFLISGLLSLIFILLAFVFRTSLFNWLQM